MENYINIDKNMVVNSTIGDIEVTWHDVRNAPFSLHGFHDVKPFYHRLPFDVAAATSEGVDKLSRESAGGRVRFSTNSPYIASRAKFLAVGRSPHIPLISSSGFDLYVDGEFGSRFIKEFRMVYDMYDSYEQIITLSGDNMRSYTINFPTHAVVESLEVGLKPGSELGEPKPYRDILPVIFYGSSIVHGTAASRPGYTYSAIISRELNIDFKNIGFSGKAKGEPVLAEYLATLPMSIFVCDYDHNATEVEHLENTHYRFYEIIREKNPDLPYIMITRPDVWTQPTLIDRDLKMRDIIMKSYLKARDNGDRNVYFIDGMSFNYAPHQYDMSVDACHPNDAGFIRMADAIGTVIRYILENR